MPAMTVNELTDQAIASIREFSRERNDIPTSLEEWLQADSDLRAVVEALPTDGWQPSEVRIVLKSVLSEEGQLRMAMASMGRRGGRASKGKTSPAKRDSSRANGARGGRPRSPRAGQDSGGGADPPCE